MKSLQSRVTHHIAGAIIIGLAPFVAYHLYLRHWMVVALLVLIIVLAGVLMLYLRRGGDWELGGLFLATTYSLGSLYAVYTFGVNGSFWLYPVVLANFYILPLGWALALNLLVVTVGPAILQAEYDLVIRLFATLAGVNFIGYVFSHQVASHSSELSELSLLDPLTGAHNRRALDEELLHVAKDRARYGTRVTALLLDIDRFKKINDRSDHHVGDAVLRQVVDLIRARLRESDQLFRYGGDEFVVIAQHTGLIEAEGVAEALRQRIGGHDFGAAGAVTLSVGVAELQPAEHALAWISRADEAMYQAKRAGRNRVCSSRTPLNLLRAPSPGH